MGKDTMGSLTDETNKIHWFLHDLDFEFANFLTIQLSFSPLPTFQDLVSKAGSSKIFQKSLETPALSSAAFAVTKGNFHLTRNEGFRKFHDREGGSFILGYGKGRGNSYSPRCQICHNIGHTTAHYPDPESFSYYSLLNTTVDWYIDTGAAGAYMTSDSSQLDKVQSYNGKDCVIVGNEASLLITHVDTFSPSPNIKLLDVLVVPWLKKKSLSIRKLTSDYPLSITFIDTSFLI
jgi:hypothetical protein